MSTIDWALKKLISMYLRTCQHRVPYAFITRYQLFVTITVDTRNTSINHFITRPKRTQLDNRVSFMEVWSRLERKGSLAAIIKRHGDIVAQLVERRPRDTMESMTRGSNPVRSTHKMCESFSESKCCADSLSVCPTPCVFACIRTYTR